MVAVQRWLALLLVTLAQTANAQDGPIRIRVGFLPAASLTSSHDCWPMDCEARLASR